MKNRLKRLNKIQIISLILLTSTYVLRIFNVLTDNIYFTTPLLLSTLGLIKFMAKWSNEGKTWFKKMDKNYNKNFTRKPSDALFFLVVAYVVVVAGIYVTNIFVDNYLTESLFALYLLTIVYNYMALVLVDKTSEDVVKFIDESGKGKVERKKKNGK